MLDIQRLYQTLVSSSEDDDLQRRPLIAHAGQIAQPHSAISPEVTGEELWRKFNENPNMAAVAVVENEVPIGLINRHIFMEQYSRRYGREIFGRKSCIAFMDKSPLIVDAATPVETLVKQAVALGNKVLTDGFITTQNGRYDGLGSGFDLMRAMSDIEAEKSKQILASINYASLIQRSHLVESDYVLKNVIGEYGLMWSPRDVVGGDAYFFRQMKDGVFGCIFDCTGHGVPGAFMTLIALSFFEQQIAPTASNLQPGELIGQLNLYIKKVLQQNESQDREVKANDGLDIAAFVLSRDQTQLRYASAKLALYLKRPNTDAVETLEAESTPVGYADTPNSHVWSTSTVALEPGTLIVIPTDGVIDQIGEGRRIAHGRKRLLAFVQEHHQLSCPALIDAFRSHFAAWQGGERRRDDVTLFTMRSRTD